MTIAIAADHAGYHLKQALIPYLESRGHTVTDFGTDSDEMCDYPPIIRPCAEAVARGEFDRGIVLGGSGNGEAIVANRVPGVRCTLCWNELSANYGRRHNNANVLSLGARLVEEPMAKRIVDIFLEEGFEGGRHLRRIEQIDAR